MTTRDRIDELVELRREARRHGISAQQIDEQLEIEWARLRREEAVARNGDAATISARARVERELERIASE